MKRRRSGELENEVIGILDGGDWMSVAQVSAGLSKRLAHTTVMTALVRLTDKGLVSRERRGRGYEYRLNAPKDSLPALRSALRMRSAMDERADRADVLANFVAALDPEDEDILIRLLTTDLDDDAGTG
ncbi:BlaI/MecI/CopY family transcriptional regulator [Gordonia sp. CPCC 205515]|uniref:BlaI/MecI/CopY family transcriptional regulator n=1 Tax=Gordonia sp. CPCC 205515 TaxID=3140791 RepID=UPI003AF339FB